MPRGLPLCCRGVYLICFERPYKHARHYIGWAKHIRKRFDRHRSGQGARLLAVVAAEGIDFKIVRTWKDADRNFERTLKNRRQAWRLCPSCRPEKLKQKSEGLHEQRN